MAYNPYSQDDPNNPKPQANAQTAQPSPNAQVPVQQAPPSYDGTEKQQGQEQGYSNSYQGRVGSHIFNQQQGQAPRTPQPAENKAPRIQPFQNLRQQLNKPAQPQQAPAQPAQQQLAAPAPADSSLDGQPPAPPPSPAANPAVLPPGQVAQPPQQQQFGPQQSQQPPVTQPRETTSGQVTSYQRLQDYLNTNQPQATGLGANIQQNVDSQATAGEQDLAQAAQKFSALVNQAGLTRNSDATSQLITKAANLKSGETLSPDELSQLTKIADTKNGFEGLAPKDLTAISDFANAQAEMTEAKGRSKLTADNSGRQALLGDIYGKNANNIYTTGQSALDSVLTGSSQPSAQGLAAQRKDLVTDDKLGKEQQTAKDAAASQRQGMSDTVNSAFNDVTSGIGMKQGEGKLGTLEQTIRDRLAAENTRIKDTNSLIDQAMSEGAVNFGNTTASKQVIQKLGLSPQDVENIRETGGTSGNLFAKMKEMNEQTGTSSDDLAKLNALYSIAGKFGRDASGNIKAVQGSDLGTGLNQKASLNQDTVQSAIKQNKDTLDRVKQDMAANLKSVTIPDYRFGRGQALPQVSNDIIRRMADGRFVLSDNVEADKAINAYSSQLSTLNSKRQAAGLPPIGAPSPSQSDIDAEVSHIISQDGSLRWVGIQNADQLKQRNPNLYNQMASQGSRIAQLKSFNGMFGV